MGQDFHATIHGLWRLAASIDDELFAQHPEADPFRLKLVRAEALTLLDELADLIEDGAPEPEPARMRLVRAEAIALLDELALLADDDDPTT